MDGLFSSLLVAVIISAVSHDVQKFPCTGEMG